jgi:hypothetical protein
MKLVMGVILLGLLLNSIVDKMQTDLIREQKEAIIALQKSKEAQNKVIMRLVNLNGGLR